jgi:hypothetical protein
MIQKIMTFFNLGWVKEREKKGGGEGNSAAAS